MPKATPNTQPRTRTSRYLILGNRTRRQQPFQYLPVLSHRQASHPSLHSAQGSHHPLGTSLAATGEATC